jgi:anti-sigma regulatory factor (Ser/Thr protein kinase)
VKLFKSLQVAADDGGLGDVFSLVEEELEKVPGCSRSDALKFHMLVDEIFTNIANYAYEDGTGMVLVSISYDDAENKVRLIFKDEGRQYDPTKEKPPDLSLPARERRAGGLGIFMVRNTVDEFIYERRDGCNILTLVKTVGGQNV